MSELSETKAWLMRGWKLDREINALQRMLDDTRLMVISTTANLQGVSVQSTKDPHKYDRLLELDDEINTRVDELVAIKLEIERVVRRVDDSRYRTLLIERYTSFKTWEQIAVDMSYSFRRIMELHEEALKRVRDVITA